MFRELRKGYKKLDEKKTKEILTNCSEGVLGTIGTNHYPYTVFLNYVYENNKIYFHCAKVGHKIDNITYNNKVSFSVYQNAVIVEKKFTTTFESVTCFGTAKLIEPNEQVLMKFIEKYAKNFLESGREYVNKGYLSTQLVEITLEHISGKGSK
jgi:hypothetical protein